MIRRRYEREVRIAVRLARRAGRLVRAARRGDLPVRLKEDRQPVTLADLLASRLVGDGLARAFPGDRVCSEEEPARGPPAARRVWYVDPIDGTWDYVRGGGDYVVQIGLCVGGTPTVGVVYQPASDRLFVGRPGRAWTRRGGRARRRLAVAACDPRRIRLARSHGQSPVVDELVAALAIDDVAVIASVGLKMCLVAAGERDLYINPSPRCRPWDSCAGAAVLGAAGGRVADLAGEPLWFSPDGAAQPGGLVAATAPLHRILADEAHRHAASRHGG